MKQITIVTRKDPELLASVSEILAEQDVNIRSFDSESTENHSIVILSVDRYDEALAALRDAGIPAVSEQAIVVRIRDEPGALARISRRFVDAGIPLRSVRFIGRSEGYGLVVLATERTKDALELVREEFVA